MENNYLEGLLKPIVDRLDKIDKFLRHHELQKERPVKLEDFIGRLDTVQNCLERQNQKQNILDDKLSKVIEMLEQQNEFVQRQVKTVHEDVAALSASRQDQCSCSAKDHTSTEDEILKHLGAIKDSCSSLPASSRLEEMMQKLEERLEETCKPSMEPPTNTKSQAFAERKDFPSIETIETLHHVIKGEIKGEFVWLNNNLDQRLAESATTIDEKLLEIGNEMADAFKKEALAVIRVFNDEMKDNLHRSTTNVQDQVIVLADRLSASAAETKDEIVNTCTELVQDARKQVETKLEDSTSQTKDYMNKIKRDISIVTEKEAQLIRDSFTGNLQQSKKYIFHFYVEDFKNLVDSGKRVYSAPWHISQLQSCIQGHVRFPFTGKMDVRLIYGRHPTEVGLRAKSPVKLKVRASIVDTRGHLPELVIGKDAVWMCDESAITTNGDWGKVLGELTCDELIEAGYGEKEAYLGGAILVKYDIEVCK